MEDIEYVFAKLAFVFASEDTDWTGATWHMRDENRVDVARRACDLDCFARTIVMVGMTVLFHAALTV